MKVAVKAQKPATHWRKIFALALFAGLMLTALALANSGRAAIETPPPPSVWSDKADYAPGEQVTLSGANWAPGESVHIRVNDDAGQTWSRDVDVTAGADGTISDQFNLPNWFVAQYSVTATGASSGTATWTFTDGTLDFQLATAGNAAPSNVTWSVNWDQWQGTGQNANNDCSGTRSSNGTASYSGNTLSSGTRPGINDNASAKPTSAQTTGLFAGQYELDYWSSSASSTTPLTGTQICQAGVNGPTVFTLYAHFKVADATPPDTSITAQPSNPANSGSANFSFTGTDNVTPPGSLTFECKLDGGSFAPCTSPRPYTGLADGSHTFQVRAKDAAGNTDATPASFTWVVDTTVPDTTITAQPSNPTNSSAASFSFTGSDSGSGVATFECKLDGGSFVACTSPQSYTALADGSHIFQVRAIDGAGNVDASPASFTWVVDTAAPDTTIDTNPNNPSNSSSASLTFSGTDGSGTGVASFECKLDAAAFAACTSPKSYSGLADGSHTFQVRAIDGAGNVDASPASSTWVVDTTAPDTTIDSNPNNPTNSSSASFTFSGTDGSGTGVASFECQLDGGSFTACTSPQSYTALADGSHTFQVRAIDGAGNVDASPASSTWVVDTTAPDTTIDSNPSDPSKNTSPSFGFSGTDNHSAAGDLSFECQLDAGGWSSCTSPESVGVTEGSHTFDVRATDEAGNTDMTPASYTWFVDTTAPTTSIDSNPSDPTNSTSASFTFSGTDNHSDSGDLTFECKLDGDSFAACSSPQSYSSLSEGSHTFKVKATDEAGNTDATPASFTWFVDTTAPQTSIDSNPSDPSKNTSPSFGFSGTDNHSSPGNLSFECQLDSGGWSSCASPESVSVTQGSHTFDVRATDEAGNTDATPASYTWFVDTTAPDTSITSHPSNPSNSASASFSFNGSDNHSAAGDLTFECKLDGDSFAACSSPQSYSSLSEGSHTFKVKATDEAGNTDVTADSFTWTVDTTGPSITLTTPPNGATYTLGQVVNASYSCSDSSGVATCIGTVANLAAINTATIGSKSFTVNATDTLGNASSETHNYTVIYNFSGFYAPVDNYPTCNKVKAGSAIPVKFSLHGYQGMNILATGSPKVGAGSCDANDVDALEETVTAGSSGLNYDATTDQYIYVWKTDKSWAGLAKRLDVTLADGTVHTARFTFTK